MRISARRGTIMLPAALLLTMLAPAVAPATKITKTCLTGNAPEVAGDAAAIRTLRVTIDAACVCGDFDGTKGKAHAAFTQCVRQTVATEVTAGHLRTQCKKKVNGFYAHSTCGTNPAVHAAPCVQTSLKSGKVTCAIKATTKKDGTTPTTACVSLAKAEKNPCIYPNADWTMCIDAADTNSDLIIGAGPGGHDTGSCACKPGFGDCNADPLDGCETSVKYNPAACGACGNICPAPTGTIAGCFNSACTIDHCMPGHLNLNGVTADGCEYACSGQNGVDGCNGIDDDCDGVVDNVLGSPAGSACDLQHDVHNCGTAGHDCLAGAVHADWSCQAGTCLFNGCQAGYYDLNGDQACEYACTFVSAQEACNGVDDNCDGQIDENVAAPAVSAVCGTSPAASTPECTTQVSVACVNGAWQCTFPVGVCNPTCAAAAEVCDGLDNNCNGLVNENVPGFGLPCASDDGKPLPGDGACRTTGTYVCNGANAVACGAVKDLSKVGPEVPDGIDNDCDGQIDETFLSKGPNATYFVKPVVTRIGASVWMYSYEASRTNATATSMGTGNGYATSAPNGVTLDHTLPTSLPNKMPWFNIGGAEAEQACASVSGHLCTTAEWQTACQAGLNPSPACMWGYAPAGPDCTSAATVSKYCNLGPTYDTDAMSAGDQDAILPTASPLLLGCSADWSGMFGNTDQLFDITGNLRELTKTASNQYTGMGGSFLSQIEAGQVCTATTFSVDGNFAFYDTGFRCCFSQDPRL